MAVVMQDDDDFVKLKRICWYIKLSSFEQWLAKLFSLACYSSCMLITTLVWILQDS